MENKYFIAYEESTGDIIARFDSSIGIPPDDMATVEVESREAMLATAAPGWKINLQTLQPEPPPAPTAAELLATAQLAQAALIDAAYAAAITAAISYTSQLGTTQTFQADADSQDVLLKAVIGYGAAAAVPPGFFWKAADNTLVQFTLDDVRGLYAAMLARGWAAFQQRTALKQAIASSSTPAACQAITWSPLP